MGSPPAAHSPYISMQGDFKIADKPQICVDILPKSVDIIQFCVVIRLKVLIFNEKVLISLKTVHPSIASHRNINHLIQAT